MQICDYCGMHLPAARMMKHRLATRFEKAVGMRIRRRDVDMEDRCEYMEFILYRR